MKLSFIDVSKKYRDIQAVDSISGEFTPGIWGLLGPNGAGKTTFMRMLVGNITPTGGKILYDEMDIRKMGDSYRDKIGYLPQQFGYDKNQSVQEFLTYMGVLKGIRREEIKVRSEELLKRFNLWEVRKKKIKKLSGGMERRVGICQVMLNDPQVIIVDEPTAGLDIEERRKFRQYLTAISKNKIVILSTHIVSDIEFIANNIVFMDRGKIILQGEREEEIKSAGGKVYETVVSEDEGNRIEEMYKVVDYRNEESGKVRLRFISHEENPRGELVEPSLKDLYLWKMKGVESWKSSSRS